MRTIGCLRLFSPTVIMATVRCLLLVLTSSCLYAAIAQDNCSIDSDCWNGGTCSIDENQCICTNGWTGPDCTTPCPLDCNNGGICRIDDSHAGLALESDFYCECPDADNMDALCNKPCPVECLNGGVCVWDTTHVVGSEQEAKCQCPGDVSRYTGSLCAYKDDESAAGLRGAGNDEINDDDKSKNTSKMVGIVLGVLIPVIVLAGIGFYLCKRRQKKAEPKPDEPEI